MLWQTHDTIAIHGAVLSCDFSQPIPHFTSLPADDCCQDYSFRDVHPSTPLSIAKMSELKIYVVLKCTR